MRFISFFQLICERDSLKLEIHVFSLFLLVEKLLPNNVSIKCASGTLILCVIRIICKMHQVKLFAEEICTMHRYFWYHTNDSSLFFLLLDCIVNKLL